VKAGREREARLLAMALPVRWAFLLALVSICPAGAAFGESSSVEPDYAGSFADGSDAVIRFDVQRSNGVREKVELEALAVELACSDGSSQRASFQPATFRFRTKNVFYARKRSFNDDIGSSSVYEVRGRLIPGGTARGYLAHERQYSFGFPPNCATNGRLRWAAEKMR
jgi:hypothetical protein